MAQTVQLKRSALTGKVPGTGSLNLGELALNTYDGKIFFRRSGSTDTVQEVVTTNVVNTGSITITGALTAESIRTTLTASFGSLKVNDTLTVNHGETIMSGSALVTNDLTILGQVNARQFNISVISSSVLFQSGSTRFGNTSDDTHDFTGSVNVTGSLYLNGTDLAAGNAQGTYVFPNAFDFNVDDTTFGDFNSASLGYNLNFGDVETVGSPIHFVGGLSNLGDTTVIYPTSRSIDFVVDDRYVGSISSQSFYTNTTFTASLQQGYTLVGNGSGVTYAVATSSIAGALPTGVVSGSSQVVSILSSLNTYTGSNDTTNTAQNTRLTTIESVTGSYETKGRGIVSGSSQITFSGISSLPTLVSGSSQITYANISSIPAGIVSGSSQTITNLPTGTVSGSIQVLGGTGIISSSAQLSDTSITNLTITNLTVVNETASVLFSSGSNRFGDFGDDTHSFTGSVKISGSITTVGSSTATSFSGAIAATNGVVSGSSQTVANLPTGTISGSSQVNVMSTTNIARLATTGSNTFIGNQTITGSVTATTGNGNSLNLRSGNAGHYTILGLGRTTQDLAIASAAAGGQFFVGAVAGDAWVGATNGTIGFGNDTSGVATMVVKGGNVLINTTTDNGAKLQVNGRMRANSFTSYGDTVSLASGATSTIYTMNDNGLYTAQCFVYGGAAIYMAAATFISLEANAQYSKCIDLFDGANVTLDNSGSSIRITNNGFATLTWSWSVLFQGY